MAFPIKDHGADGAYVGVVLVGTASGEDATVLAAARAGQGWPPNGPFARCLVSLDYGSQAALGQRIVGVQSGTLATFYATWNVQAAEDSTRYTVDDGLGLILPVVQGTAGPLASISVQTRDPRHTGYTRMAFSRAVLYGTTLVTGSAYSTIPGPNVYRPDVTKGVSFNGSGVTVTTIGATTIPSPFLPPQDWALIPTWLDHALFDDGHAIRNALSPGDSTPLVEGLPGLRVDDRYLQLSVVDPATGARWLTLGSGGLAHLPAGAGIDGPNNPWLIEPSPISISLQDLEAAALTHLRPTGPATYGAAVSSGGVAQTLMHQKFPLLDPSLPAPTIRGVEAVWPDPQPNIATSEANARYGNRWTTNDSATDPFPSDCWFTVNVDHAESRSVYGVPYRLFARPGSSAIARDWCPSIQSEWWVTHYGRTQDRADGACYASTQAQNNVKNAGSFLNALPNLSFASCNALKPLASGLKDAGCCLAESSALCFFGCDCCSAATVGKDVIGANAQCVMDWVASEFHDQVTNDRHWLDATSTDFSPTPGHVLTSLVTTVHTGFPSSLNSVAGEITPGGDLFMNRAHQGNDWNWKILSHAIDPRYRGIAFRDASGINAATFRQMENEIELLIPEGRWKESVHDVDDEDPGVDLHSHDAFDYVVNGLDQDWLGEIWPDQLCLDYGLDVEVPGDFEEAPVPGSHCGGQLYTKVAWREMFGRSMIAPLVPLTLTGTASHMSLNSSWPSSPSDPDVLEEDVGMGVDDWSGDIVINGTTYRDFPHRLGFLGRPILDCGHQGSQLELHPPHVITMETRLVPDSQGAYGLELAAFGWINVAIEGHLEFDLWPTPRPSGNARLVTHGETTPLSSPAQGLGSYGYVIDENGPTHAPGTHATLQCTPQPVLFPNHLHCAFDDPSPGLWTGTLDYLHDNPRMDPKFASSRFDLRFFLGWEQ